LSARDEYIKRSRARAHTYIFSSTDIINEKVMITILQLLLLLLMLLL